MTPLMLSLMADGHSTIEHDTSHDRRTAIAEILIDRHADVNAIGASGWTPLLFAAFYGQAGALKHLLKARANLYHVDTQGRGVGTWMRYGTLDREKQKAL